MVIKTFNFKKKIRFIVLFVLLISSFLILILINNLLFFAFSTENYRNNVNCKPIYLQNDLGFGIRYVNTLYMGESTVVFPENPSQMKNLENLEMVTCPISEDNLKAIGMLPNLKRLDLTDTGIDSLESISSLDTLEALDLSSNEISTIENIEGLENLQYLILQDNNIDKIEGIENLKNILLLDLSSNEISTIENIETIPLNKNYYYKKIKGGSILSRENLENSGKGIKSCTDITKKDRLNGYTIANTNYECGEYVSTLQTVDLTNNPIKYITKGSLEYINKYEVEVELTVNSSTFRNFNEDGTFNYNWVEDAGIEVI